MNSGLCPNLVSRELGCALRVGTVVTGFPFGAARIRSWEDREPSLCHCLQGFWSSRLWSLIHTPYSTGDWSTLAIAVVSTESVEWSSVSVSQLRFRGISGVIAVARPAADANPGEFGSFNFESSAHGIWSEGSDWCDVTLRQPIRLPAILRCDPNQH